MGGKKITGKWQEPTPFYQQTATFLRSRLRLPVWHLYMHKSRFQKFQQEKKNKQTTFRGLMCMSELWQWCKYDHKLPTNVAHLSDVPSGPSEVSISVIRWSWWALIDSCRKDSASWTVSVKFFQSGGFLGVTSAAIFSFFLYCACHVLNAKSHHK